MNQTNPTQHGGYTMQSQMEGLRNRLISALSQSNEALDVVAHIDFAILFASASGGLNDRLNAGAQPFANQGELSSCCFRHFVTNNRSEYDKYRDQRCGGDYMIANGPLAETLGVLAFLLILSVPGFNRLWGDIPIQQ